MLPRERIDDATFRWTTPRCVLTMRVCSDSVIATQLQGHIDEPLGVALLAFLDEQPKLGRARTLFHEWSGLTGYDSATRTLLTQWQSRSKADFDPVHVHIASRIVAMGVAVANVALGGSLKVHADRDAFDAAMRAAGATPFPRPA